MRIGIDGRFLSHPQPGGFKAYAEGLIRGLAEIEREHEYVVYVDRPLAETEEPRELRGAARIRLEVVAGTAPYIGMPWREQVGLPRRARQDRIDLFHFPAQTGALAGPCPAVVTLFDTLWAGPIAPEWRRSPTRLALAVYMRHIPALVARRAAAIITGSETARQDLVAKLALPPARVHVTPLAPHPAHRRIEDPRPLRALRARYRLAERLILGLGSADPRKNVAGLLRAYALLPPGIRGPCQLAIVCTHGYLARDWERLARSLGIAEQVRWLGQVPDWELTALYNAASLFVYPSLGEGFGLPPLEAMACGTPVVASDCGALPEVLGEGALLVPVDQGPAPLAAAMAAVLSDGRRARALAEGGRAWVGRYSWERCARETVAVYEGVKRQNVMRDA